MNITEIIALAKQGYKPSDIKELIELANESNHDNDNPNYPEPDNPEDEQDVENIDYKALYEAQTEEINKLKADNKKVSEILKQAQKDNINKDVSDNEIESPQKILEDFFKAR